MRNRYALATNAPTNIPWLRAARTVAEYALAVGAALVASYMILQGRW